MDAGFDGNYTRRRKLAHPGNGIPVDAEPLLWEGVIFGDYWITPAGKTYKRSGQEMPWIMHHTGYWCVSVIKNDKSRSLNVHNLIKYTFDPIPSKLLPAIDHLDVDKSNCTLDNLEWTGQAENTRRAYQEGANKSAQAVAAYDIDGNFVDAFYSISNAVEEMEARGKKSRVKLKSIIAGSSRRKNAYGYRWTKITNDEYQQLRRQSAGDNN